MNTKWQRAVILTATADGILERNAWVYRGIGLRQIAIGSWSLVHIGTGHRLCQIDARDAMPVATEIAEAIDWDYSSLDGWRNVSPDMPEKFNDIMDRRPEIKLMGGAENPEMAREVAASLER